MAAKGVAVNYAVLNMPNSGTVLADSDVNLGVWNPSQLTFAPGTSSANAVRVVARRSAQNNNPMPLFFARVLGHSQAEVSAEAVGMFVPIAKFRYLLDEDMIDSDESGIVALARQRGVSPESLISDINRDGWIDLPPGAILELPTGQVGDEGMFFQVSKYDFPFRSNTKYTMLQFLAEATALRTQLGYPPLQDVTWTSSDAPHRELIGKKILDPVLGVDPMNTHDDILTLPDPNGFYISPVYKSDISVVEKDPSKYGSTAVNLLGERRGLFAYKILSTRPSPKGGSYLPWVTLEVVNPAVLDLKTLEFWGESTSQYRIEIVQ